MNRFHLVLLLAVLAACKPRPFDVRAFGKKLLHAAPAVPPPTVTPVAVQHTIEPKTQPPPPATTTKRPPPVATKPPARPPRQAAFAAHARTQAGANSCSAHPSMEQCTSHCTSVLRTSSMDRSPSAVRSCNCVEQGC